MWPEGEAERGRGMECCGCAEGPRSAASSASPASAETWLLACLVTRPFRVNRTEASWNQNTYKSWPLWKTLPRSINTLEVVIDMWEGSVALLASIGRQTTTWILSPGKFQALADVCWHTYMWQIETLLPPALCASLRQRPAPGCRQGIIGKCITCIGFPSSALMQTHLYQLMMVRPEWELSNSAVAGAE